MRREPVHSRNNASAPECMPATQKRGVDRPCRALYRTSAWRKLRAEHLTREPWCRMHEARGEHVAAGHVDHIKAHRGNAALFFDRGNLQSLCARCHNSIKQSHERGRFVAVGADGWPVEANSD